MIAALAIVALLVVRAPPGPLDPTISAWFESLRSPAGAVCCGVADGRVLKRGEWDTGPSGYRVRLADGWQTVPRSAVILDGANPMDGPVLFALDRQIICFVPVSGV